jgi:hypothetical protein
MNAIPEQVFIRFLPVKRRFLGSDAALGYVRQTKLTWIGDELIHDGRQSLQ